MSEGEEIEYLTYKEELPAYMAGYTGHVPYSSQLKKQHLIHRIIHQKHIPGYMGFTPSIKAENKFGESYGKETYKSLAGRIPKGSDVPNYKRFMSMSREHYIDQRKVITDSTAKLLGIKEPNIKIKAPIPGDSINKFFGVVGNKNDKKIIGKQQYERNYEKFWQFLEANELDFIEKKTIDVEESNRNYWGVEQDVQDKYPEEMKFDPIVGYMGTSRFIQSENIIGKTYKNTLRYANELLLSRNKQRAEELKKSTEFKSEQYL